MNSSGMRAANGNTGATTAERAATPVDSPANKPKRVRTGCLTCRERHLKCDEAQPICLNCKKSNRNCKRGVRLNFIDTTVRLPPTMAPTHDWNVHFMDESREIASEYRGGLAKYAPREREAAYQVEHGMIFDFSGPVSHLGQHHALPPIHGMLPESYQDDQASVGFDRHHREAHHRHNHSHSESTYSGSNLPTTAGTSYGQPEPQNISDSREYIREGRELGYMQAFVEDVGIWMDCMDASKHFSEQLPHHALSNNMLYTAFLACGARHLAVVNPEQYSDETALQYYNSATSYLLQNLQDEKRDSVTCATTAVILNVYEVMSEKYSDRMSHIAGARALIKECGWSARASGIGAACFWLNIGMELLSCLAKNYPVAWDPDEWGVDMDFSGPVGNQHGNDEVWAHRMVYIVAKIVNFRSSSQSSHEYSRSPREEQLRRQNRMNEWQHLKGLLDSWNGHVPRTMHPMGYVDPYKTRINSSFPEVWIIRRPAIMARLLYHTALVLLSQANPLAARNTSRDMKELEMENALLICGIVAHNKDKGVASVAIRAIAIAAECIIEPTQQQELLSILKTVAGNTGWNVSFLFKELPKKWGWPSPHHSPKAHTQTPQQQHVPPQPQPMRYAPAQQMVQTPQPRARNPLATADFSMPQHPYQSHYVAPNSTMTRHSSASYY